MGKMHIDYGLFMEYGHIPYARWGTGNKIILLLSGGPGNMVTKGIGTRLMTGSFDAFAEQYTLYYLGRRRGMPAGYATRDMSEDYARLIEGAFGGHVDVVVGMSYGGLIVQHLAVDYPGYFRRVVVLMAAHRGGEEGGQIDYRAAQYLRRGKRGKAMAAMMEALYTKGLMQSVMKLLSYPMGSLFFRDDYPEFCSDVMVEAEAALSHDTGKRLSGLTVPVLLICGAEDIYFPRQIVEETARLMGEHGILKLYAGRGHMDLMDDARFIPDLRAFIEAQERP